MKIIIFIVVYFVSITIMNALIRKALGVEKKRFLSTTHYFNDFHRYGEGTITFVLVIIGIALPLSASNTPSDSIQPLFVFALIGACILLAVFRAIFEKKYADNPKDYLYTLSEMGVAIVILVVSIELLFPGYLI